MKVPSTLLVIVAASAVAGAQAGMPPSQVIRQVNSARKATQRPQAQEMRAASAPAPQRALVSKPAVAREKQGSHQTAVHKAAAAEPVAVIPLPASPLTLKANKRDPFVSPIVRAETVHAVPCEGAGKKCLSPDEVVLRGIVQGPNGMIAVVESTGRKISYFLRENDPVFNGYVVKITSDSVVFRENTSDTLGRHGTRDITKRVNAPAV